MHTLKIGVLDVSNVVGGYDFDLFREIALPRLHALAPLRYQLVDIPLSFHHPMWVQNAEIDVDYHLRRARVAAPGGRRELDELIGQIASTPLDRGRPLWEMYIAEGLADNRIAIIHKVHHVLADGVASANQMAMAIAAQEPDLGGQLPDAPDRLARAGEPAQGRRARPSPPDSQVAASAQRDGHRSGPGAAQCQGARTAIPIWPAISRRRRRSSTTSSRRAGGSRPPRWRSAMSRRPPAPRRDTERHRVGDGRRRAAPAPTAVRRSGRRAADRRRAGQCQHLAAPPDRQRIHLHDTVACPSTSPIRWSGSG